MRILHIVSTMRPEAGGPAEAIRLLLKYQPAGYTSEVVTLDAPGASPFHDLGPVNTTFGYTPRLIPWLRSNRHRFDGVIVHGLWQFIGVAARIALGKHIPYVVFPHGMLDPYFKRAFPFKHLKKWPFWLLSEYWLLRRAMLVLFTTAAERDLAVTSFWLHRWRARIVPLGTEPAPAVDAAMREAFFAACSAVRGHRFLLFLGRVDPKKGCDLLLQAFTACAPHAPDLHLVIAGPCSGPWATALRAKSQSLPIAERIHWPGMLQGAAKHAAFDLCEAFILPSHQENFGIAVVEALAAGKPVLLTSPINIAPEISTDGCGIVASDTPAGIQSLITQWIQLCPEAAQNMCLAASKSWRTRYDIRRNAASILTVFEPTAESVTR